MHFLNIIKQCLLAGKLPMPAGTKNYDVTVNGKPAGQTVREGNFIKIADQGSGKNAYILNTK